MSLDNPFFISGLALVGIGFIKAALLYVQVVRERKQDGSDSE
ncbi:MULTISPECIES: hypothetical protein [Streptomyces]|uniref:Integral membrane protein n=1 Tax=Streptomyces griseiscabiei TaxID=2993540 RepID=A0ABU4L288_9ACTN|nr:MULTISPECIES: hypothetical protein [Streptomyces]MDX2909860.1 hypothetical protein [Streptomyces griseiscabiei]